MPTDQTVVRVSAAHPDTVRSCCRGRSARQLLPGGNKFRAPSSAIPISLRLPCDKGRAWLSTSAIRELGRKGCVHTTLATEPTPLH